LSADTQHMIERCNRLNAFQVLDELAPRLEIAADDRLFGAGTELESVALADALIRRIAQPPAKTVVLWLDNDAPGWELDEWPARTLAEMWGPRGVPIRFAVRPDTLRMADLSVRQSLARLVQRCQNAELVKTIDAKRLGTPLAAIVDGDCALAWASRDASAAQTGAGWGRSPIAPVVRGFPDSPLFAETLDVAMLLSPAPETAIVEIAGSADGPASGFGQRLRRALEAQAGDLLRGLLEGGPEEIVYSDRYVFSPLSALLVAELVGAFARRVPPKILVRTRTASKSVHATPPWQVQHDWTTQSDRLAVLQKLLARFSEKAHVDLDDATPHRRTLVLNSETDAVELTLDQGVGPWQPADRYRFDFGWAPEEQAQGLLKMPIRVMNPGPATFVVIRKLSGA
jgi:hypothetical protein